MKRAGAPPWMVGAAALAGGVAALVALATGLSRVLFQTSPVLPPQPSAASPTDEVDMDQSARAAPAPLPAGLLEAVYWPADQPGAADDAAAPLAPVPAAPVETATPAEEGPPP